MRLQERLGRSALRCAQGIEDEELTTADQDQRPGPKDGPGTKVGTSTKAQIKEQTHAQSETTTLEDTDREAPHARRPQGDRSQRVSALPRTQAAAPRVLELRVLPRAPGARRRRGLAPVAALPSAFAEP